MPKFLITMPSLPEVEVKRAWMKVLKARRTAEDQLLKMERAYVDEKSGRTTCCWEAGERSQIEDLFQRAGVSFASITPVTEVLEKDLA